MARREKADIEAIIQLVDPGPVFASFRHDTNTPSPDLSRGRGII